MKTAALIGPVQFVALTYFICIIVSLGIAWFISMLFSGIRWQEHIVHAHAIAEKMAREKDITGKEE